MKDEYKHITECYLDMGEKWCNSFLVTYPVSITYNGGFVEYTYKSGETTLYPKANKKAISSKWYKGFKVVSPKVPKGYKLTGIGCGLQLNAHPPYATAYLEPLDGKKKDKREVAKALSNV